MPLTALQKLAVDQIADAAVKCEHLTNCPAEFTASQCIFESAYLTRAPNNNCFGIKADQHGSGTQYVLTHEYLNGQWKEMVQAFEKYNSLADCFADHARLIQTGVYETAWKQYQSDHFLSAYIRGVAEHYATNPDYAEEMVAESYSDTVRVAVSNARQRLAPQ